MSESPFLHVRLRASMEDFVRVMAKTARAVEKMCEDPRFRRLLGLPRRDVHHPTALSIDGVAYHQRRRARRRRNRR